MATRESIRADLNAAYAQANQLENAARRLDSAAGDAGLNGSLSMVQANWTGNNANNYLNKGHELKRKMNTSASRLNQIAGTIRTVAKNIYDAELRNIELAEQREAEAARNR